MAKKKFALVFCIKDKQCSVVRYEDISWEPSLGTISLVAWRVMKKKVLVTSSWNQAKVIQFSGKSIFYIFKLVYKILFGTINDEPIISWQFMNGCSALGVSLSPCKKAPLPYIKTVIFFYLQFLFLNIYLFGL